MNTLNNSSGAKFDNQNTIHASTVANKGDYQNSTGTSVLEATVFNNTASTASFINNGTSTIGTLNNARSITGDNGSLRVTNGGYSSGSIVQDTINLTSGNFNNTGSMTSNTTFTNHATITDTLNTGSLTIAAGLSDGVITQKNISISGAFDNDADINATTLLTNSGNIDNSAKITAKSLTNTGTITGDTGDLEIGSDGGSSTSNISQRNITLKGGTFANGAGMTANTKLTIDAGAQLNNTNTLSAATLENNGGLTNNSTLSANNLTTGAGSITTNNGSATVYGSVTNGGTLTNATGSTLGTATLTNNAGAVFDNDGAATVNGTLTNKGTMTNKTNGTVTANKLVNDTSAVLTNNNSISAAIVENKGSLTNNKTIVADTIETFAGSVTTNNDSITAYVSVTNGGTLTNNSTGNIATADFTNSSGALLTNDGTVTSTGTFTNNNLVNNSGESKGILNVNNGSNNGPMTQGTLNIASGNTGFSNNNTMKIESALNNAGILNNTSDIIVANTANNANLNNTNTINSTANSTITADTLTNTGGTMNLTKSKVAIIYQADDIKGVINVLGSDASTDKTDLSITGTKPNFAGNLNIGNSNNYATLNLESGNIVEDAITNIASGSILNVDDSSGAGTSSVVIDRNNDTYAGDITLASGTVTMKDLTVKTGDTSTTAGGTLPYYEQTGGALTLTNSTLSMVDSSLISGGNLTVDTNSTFNSLSNAFTVDNLSTAGLVNGINGGYENYAVANNFVVGDTSGDNKADFMTDIYARSSSNYKYDSFGSDSATIKAANGTDGILHVSDWTLNGDLYGWDAPIERHYNLDKLFKGSVETGTTIDFTATNKEVFTPIGWYGLHSAGNGKYTFDLNRYNPGVFRGQVSKIAQYQNQLMIDDILFSHTMLDQGFKGNDYIASNPNRLASATDLYPPYQYSRKDGGLWVKMYGTFEKLNMNHGLNVGNNAYGTIIGADFGLKELKHGWQFMPTAYIAYNGAHQYWNGYGAYQNGGQAGFMGTFYKNNWIIGALAYGGVYNNDMDTPRGNDDTLGYFGGGAVKTAYNWNFAKDWSLQPNLLVSYNYFGKENWHTDFGQMGMMSGQLHGINIAPGVNLIWEKETFSIYGTLQYMYNVNQSVGGRAGNVDLPNVHMDRGYIQYGLGFNKRFGDRFNGFLQAVIRNVGRTGIGLQAGFQWQLGKGGTGEINGKTPELKKTEIILHNQKIQ